jgi:hypothetical protein
MRALEPQERLPNNVHSVDAPVAALFPIVHASVTPHY